MKNVFWIAVLLILTGFKSVGQATEVMQLGLNIEKLAQLKSILSNMKKGYDIVSKGYNAVKDISQGNFRLHRVFLDSLLEVSPVVKNYWKVKDIVECQLNLIRTQKNALATFSAGGLKSKNYVGYIEEVYQKLVQGSSANLDELITVLTAGKTRMNDLERLETIDRIHQDVSDKLMFARHFNDQNKMFLLQAGRLQGDVDAMRVYYGDK